MTVQDALDQLTKVPKEYRQCELLLNGDATDEGMYVTLSRHGKVVLISNKQIVIEAPKKDITTGGVGRSVPLPPIRGRREEDE